MQEKEFYTGDELDDIMYSYIKETANELKIDLKGKSLDTKKTICIV
jgi:hypothetical protein